MTKPSQVPEREILEMAKLPGGSGFVVRLSYAIALLGHDCDGCNHSACSTTRNGNADHEFSRRTKHQ